MSAVLNVTPCSVLYMDQYFRDTSCLHLLTSIASVLELHKCLSETLASVDRNVQHYIPGNGCFDTDHHKSVTYCSLVQGDSFGVRPKKMRISQRLFIRFLTRMYDYIPCFMTTMSILVCRSLTS